MISSQMQQMQCTNPFEQQAEALDAAGEQQRAKAKQDLKEAGGHAGSAVAHVAGAAVNVVVAGAKVVQGTARAAKSAGHLAAAGGLPAAAAAAWAAETALSSARFVAASAAKGFAALANGLGRAACEGKTVTVREVQSDTKGTKLSARLLSAASAQVEKSGEALRGAGDSYAGAVAHLAGSAVNVGYAAGHTLAVAGNLVQAAVRSGSAARLEQAEHDARLAAAAVEAARQGVEGAAELAVLAARFSAGTANVLAQRGEPQLQVEVRRQRAACDAEVRRLAQRRPQLWPVLQQQGLVH